MGDRAGEASLSGSMRLARSLRGLCSSTLAWCMPRSLLATFVVAVLTLSCSAQSWRDGFAAPNSSLFVPMVGLRHCDDVCFEADDRMLQYGADLGGGRKGLIVTTSADVCASCAKAGDRCYDAASAKCAPFSSQYLMSADPKTGVGRHYRFGRYDVSMRTGHRANGSAATGTFSCFTPGTTPAYNDTSSKHNEIAICFDGAQPDTVKFLYWYNQTIHKTVHDLGFDSSAALHRYGASWHPDRIDWSVDGKVVHSDIGIAHDTIPWEETVMVVGLLKPHGAAATGTSLLAVEYVSYNPD